MEPQAHSQKDTSQTDRKPQAGTASNGVPASLPAPYYHDSKYGITIYHGDCRSILPQLEPVDLVLTDPPYGKNLSNHSKGKDRRSGSFNIIGDDSQKIGNIVVGMCENFPRIFFASPMKPWGGKWQQWLVWDKGPAVGGGGDYDTYWKFSYELIQVANLGLLQGKRDEGVLRFWVVPKDSELHPAQKPDHLIKYLISKTLAETILDPFMGSSTTLVAAKQLGRKAIGIEIEEKYCEIAVRRLQQDVFQWGGTP